MLTQPHETMVYKAASYSSMRSSSRKYSGGASIMLPEYGTVPQHGTSRGPSIDFSTWQLLITSHMHFPGAALCVRDDHGSRVDYDSNLPEMEKHEIPPKLFHLTQQHVDEADHTTTLCSSKRHEARSAIALQWRRTQCQKLLAVIAESFPAAAPSWYGNPGPSCTGWECLTEGPPLYSSMISCILSRTCLPYESKVSKNSVFI